MFSDTTNGGGRPVLPFQLSSLCFLAATPPCTGGEGISSHWSQEREVTGFAWLNHHKPKGSFSCSPRTAHRLFNLFWKEKQDKKTSPKPKKQQHTGKSRCVLRSWENKGQRLRQEVTLGWEVSIPGQEDKFGKVPDRTSTCCPTGMDAVCEMLHCFNTLGQARVAWRNFCAWILTVWRKLCITSKPQVSATGTAIGTGFMLWWLLGSFQ